MKKQLLLISIIFPACLCAQFHLASFNKNVNTALEKVIEDYPNHFNSIRGEVISREPQSVNYACTVNVEGSDSSIIIQNGNEQDNIFSWKQIVFETDDFNDAKSKFREYFNIVKGTSAYINSKPIKFQGMYEPLKESSRFASIIFSPAYDEEEIKNVVIDLHVQYLLSTWQISISVYEHKDYGVDDNNK